LSNIHIHGLDHPVVRSFVTTEIPAMAYTVTQKENVNPLYVLNSEPPTLKNISVNV